MTPIRSLDQLVAELRNQPSRRVAVAAGHDPHTIAAAGRAAAEGIADITLVGDGDRIVALCAEHGLDADAFTVIDERDPVAAGRIAVGLVRGDGADVLMKGLIGTGDYMRLILDKKRGLLPKGAILTHLTVMELPSFVERHGKLLFVSDVAIIPAPDLAAKLKILGYCVTAAHSFGIAEPRAALIAATEKVNPKMSACTDAPKVSKILMRGLASSPSNTL